MEKPKASENLAKDVETKPQKPQSFYALTDSLRAIVVNALQTSSPKMLSVGEINNICNALERLRPISIGPPKETTNDKKT
jgi:hypothetical protein